METTKYAQLATLFFKNYPKLKEFLEELLGEEENIKGIMKER